ncbi:YegP family protein [Ohtaekwangia koreensis]|uniref:DUF1508 domain-containing protein n=1 Tax=Ohtaekwangia koreensis TaxID=688867 RepID=A0A1T5L8B4_9BACT|nr:YegP family protein [Ohtaekwangia koreensis]SKC72267.1 hypothetical protein SAMN05660236_2745 [Ohtaekwangia koreensis]
MNYPKFQLLRSSNSQYYFVLRSKGNGEVILKASETYTTKQNCNSAIDSVRINAPYDSRYTKKDSLSNYTFNLKAANGQILSNSESYTSSSARDNGIEAVKRDAPGAPVEDLT